MTNIEKYFFYFDGSAILMNSPAFMLSGGLSCFIGFVAFAYYADKGCDPLKSKQIYNANQVPVL